MGRWLSARLLSRLAALSAPDRPVARLERDVFVPVPLDRAFGFFADASNLERITPPWLNFRILTPRPLTLRAGAEIHYEVVLYGIPIPWHTRIDVWEPGVMFVDRQLAGPYRWWRHEHRFEPVLGGTRVIDVVEYIPRARWLSSKLVQRDLDRIFEFRGSALATALQSGA